jgi:hypothetical protein
MHKFTRERKDIHKLSVHDMLKLLKLDPVTPSDRVNLSIDQTKLNVILVITTNEEVTVE